jgi:hypothetical protein
LNNNLGNGQTVEYIPSHLDQPTDYTWTFNIQRELPFNMFFEAGYVGTRGLHLWFYRDLNQVPDNLLGPGNEQPNRPFPAFQGIDAQLDDGQSSYNSLYFVLKRQIARGLDFDMNYTFSKSLDDSSYDFGNQNTGELQDMYNLRAEWAASDRNHPSIFNAQLIYEIPQFGPGRFGRLVARGWQANNVIHANSGNVMNMGVAANDSNKLSNALRPNRSCNGAVSDPTISEWFDPSCFSIPAPYTLGNSSRNPLIGPHYLDWDFSLFKNTYFKTPLNEQTNLQFRAEFLNFLNHPNWYNPNTTIGSAGAGVISGSFGPRSIDMGFRIIF